MSGSSAGSDATLGWVGSARLLECESLRVTLEDCPEGDGTEEGCVGEWLPFRLKGIVNEGSGNVDERGDLPENSEPGGRRCRRSKEGDDGAWMCRSLVGEDVDSDRGL